MADPNWILDTMAAMRLMKPDWVIPAVSALNLAEKDGYRRGLRAGANLVTINLTPQEFRGDYVIYKRDRYIITADWALEALAAEGLSPARRRLADFYAEAAVDGCGNFEASQVGAPVKSLARTWHLPIPILSVKRKLLAIQ